MDWSRATALPRPIRELVELVSQAVLTAQTGVIIVLEVNRLVTDIGGRINRI